MATLQYVYKLAMAERATGVRVVFFGSHKQPSYVVEACAIPTQDDLREGEILIKILLTTVCPYDLDSIDGKSEAKIPCVLGHEGVGEVVFSRRLLNGAPAVNPGERIAFSMINHCGLCSMCREELQECCCEILKYGSASLKDGSGLNGCYSTHMVLKQGTHIVQLPNNVSNAVASPANCALATMINAVGFLTANEGLRRSVAVIQGANLMGLYGCALLHEAGFQEVYCQDVSSEKLRLVPKFSGIPVLLKREYEYCTNQPTFDVADVVINVCGDNEVVPFGLRAIRHSGIYVFVRTSHKESIYSISIDAVIRKCIMVKGIQGYKAIHLEKAIDFLAHTANTYPYELLVSTPVSLHDFHAAVILARSQRYYRIAIKPEA